jgi:hypothetical protein
VKRTADGWEASCVMECARAVQWQPAAVE